HNSFRADAHHLAHAHAQHHAAQAHAQQQAAHHQAMMMHYGGPGAYAYHHAQAQHYAPQHAYSIAANPTRVAYGPAAPAPYQQMQMWGGPVGGGGVGMKHAGGAVGVLGGAGKGRKMGQIRRCAVGGSEGNGGGSTTVGSATLSVKSV
ncbi:hypothetical protein HK101_011386, partial [Irineochytrium annulatum]